MQLRAFAALGAASLALAAPARPHHTQQVALAISPYHVIGAAGQHYIRQSITVTNLSTGPVRVTTGFLSISQHGTGCRLGVPPSWVRVSPASFVLRRHASRRTLVLVDAPRSARGSYDLAAVYGAKPADASTGTVLHVSGAVGARVLVSLGGSARATACKPAAAIATTHRGAGSGMWSAVTTAGGALLALLAAIAAGWAITRGRRGTRHRIRSGGQHRPLPRMMP